MTQRTQVLIVDDRLHSRKGLRALLTTNPEINIIGEAVNGQEAICQTEKYQPDVVLMDVQMPVMDGLEATRLIKERWPAIKVIMLTIYANHKDDALDAGADAFLVKGCQLEELLAAMTDPSKSNDL